MPDDPPERCWDLASREVQVQIGQACKDIRPVLCSGIPCNSHLVFGFEGGLVDPRGQVLYHVLQITWKIQASGLVLECVTEIQNHGDTMQLLSEFAMRMQLQLHQITLELSDQWASKRHRWWAVLLPAFLPGFTLLPWPKLPTKLCVRDVMPTLQVWPQEQERDLAWTDREAELMSDPAYGRDRRHLDLHSQAPTALHSWGSALAPCPCGCRSEGFSTQSLLSRGLRGVGVFSASVQGFRFLHPAEVGFLNSLPVTFKHLPDSRAALCLVGQLTAPLQAVWIFSQVKEWTALVFSLPVSESPQSLLSAFKDMLQHSRHDCWPPSEPIDALLWISREGTSQAIRITAPIQVHQLVCAEKALLGLGLSVRVYSGSRLLPPHAFLHPNNETAPYVLTAADKKARKEIHSAAPGHDASLSKGTSDVTIWSGLMRLQAASQLQVFVVPPAIATSWVAKVVVSSSGLSFTWPSSCNSCLVPFVWEGHWSLLVLSQDRQAGTTAALHDGLPERNREAAKALADALLAACGLPRAPLVVSPTPLQQEPDECGPVLIASAAGILLGEHIPFPDRMQDALAFCRLMPTHCALLYGCGGLSEAQSSELRAMLTARGVPESALDERIQGAVQKIGVGPIQKALQASNVWQSLKAAGSSPGSLYRWVRPEELKAFVQTKADQKFGTAIGNAKARKQKPSKSIKPVLNVDPLALQIAPGSFVTTQNTPLAQLAFEEVGPQAQGIAFCTAQQLLPFVADYRPLSVDGLAIVSTAPLPTEACSGAPCSHIRFPAVYSPTQEAVLLSGTLLQLGDEHIQLATGDADMGSIDQLDTMVGRLSFYRDETQLNWEDFVKSPIRAMLQHIPGLSLCKEPSCKGDCSHFHPAVDEQVEQMLLDVWSRQFAKAIGGRAAPAQAEVFQALVRVPSSAVKHLQRLQQPGVYFEPRAASGFGPHPSFAVVWLPGYDKAQALHALRTTEKALGLARLGAKYGLRVMDADEKTVFETLRPSQSFVKAKVLARWRLHPLPHGMQRKALVQLLAKWGWAAKPLQPSRGDSSGSAWEVGGDSEPPAAVMPFGDGFVLIHKIRDLGPQAKPVAICASARTRQRILYDDPEKPSVAADPWSGGRDPWSAARPPPGLPLPTTSPSTPSTSSASTKLLQLKTELQDGLATLVRQHVQDAVPAAASSQTAQAHEGRLQQLEVGLQEVRRQNSKFEEWFQTFGSQMQQQAGKVDDLHKTLTHQQTEISQVKTEVSAAMAQAMSALHQDMSKQLAAQTASLEAMLSKKPRTE